MAKIGRFRSPSSRGARVRRPSIPSQQNAVTRLRRDAGGRAPFPPHGAKPDRMAAMYITTWRCRGQRPLFPATLIATALRAKFLADTPLLGHMTIQARRASGPLTIGRHPARKAGRGVFPDAMRHSGRTPKSRERYGRLAADNAVSPDTSDRRRRAEKYTDTAYKEQRTGAGGTSQYD